MTEEFNLSDKIVDYTGVETHGGKIYTKDVKEFIRRLKEEYVVNEDNYPSNYIEKLDKLAGDKLK